MSPTPQRGKDGLQPPPVLGLLPPHLLPQNTLHETWPIYTRWGHHFLVQPEAAGGSWVSPACTWVSVSPGKWSPQSCIQEAQPGQACEVGVLSLLCSPTLLHKDPGPPSPGSPLVLQPRARFFLLHGGSETHS